MNRNVSSALIVSSAAALLCGGTASAAVTAIPHAAPAISASPVPKTPVLPAAPVAVEMPAALPVLPTVERDVHAPDHTRILTERHDGSLTSTVALSLAAGAGRQQADEHGAAGLLAELIAQTPVELDGAKLSLNEAVLARGGSLRYIVDDTHITYILTARTARLPELLSALTAAMSRPAFDSGHLQTARRFLERVVKSQEHNPTVIGMNVFRSGFYRDSSAGLPALATPAEIAAVNLRELREFKARTYRRNGATVAYVGDVRPPVETAISDMLQALPAGDSIAVPLLGWKPLPGNSLVLANADIATPVVVIGYRAPEGNSADFAAMYVLETVFQSSLAYDSITTMADRGYGPFHISYDYRVRPADLTITVTSAGDAPVTAARTITALVDVLGTRLLDADAVNALKKLSIGRYVMQTGAPEEEALRMLSLADLGQRDDAGQHVLQEIAAVTPADLQRVVRRYCTDATFARVAPRSEQAP